MASAAKSPGFNPTTDYKVFPFDNQLKGIVTQLSKVLKKKNPQPLNFNSLEIKLYHGKNIFEGLYHRDNRTENKLIRDDGNKVVRFHCDSTYHDNGLQSSTDTSVGGHPTATLTIGNTRQLTFVRHTKDVSEAKWVPDSTYESDIPLSQGSIFVLLSHDETPQPTIGSSLCKYKHGVKCKGDGISVALVFRSIQETALADFCVDTNRCHWKSDDNLEPRVRSSVKKQRCPTKRKRELHNPLSDTLISMRRRCVKSLQSRQKTL